MDRSAEVEAKLDSVRRWLGSDRDGVLLKTQADFAWITAGGRSHVSLGGEEGIAAVLVTEGGAHAFAPNIEVRRLLDEELDGLPFELREHPWHGALTDADLVKEIVSPERTVTDSSSSDLSFGGIDLARLRFTLLEPEVERYRDLGRDAAEAVERACDGSRPGDNELEVAARLAAACMERDILPLVNLVASDERIALYRHPIPTTRRLERTLFVALTGRRHGLHASCTRMVSFGELDSQRSERQAAVARVDASYIRASTPGRSLGDALQVGIERYASEGYAGEWELHHQGGLTGYGGREIFATPGEPHELEASQALAWNPSITGTKSEDTVLIHAEGFEVVTRTGAWPELAAEVADGTVPRPAIKVF